MAGSLAGWFGMRLPVSARPPTAFRTDWRYNLSHAGGLTFVASIRFRFCTSTFKVRRSMFDVRCNSNVKLRTSNVEL